MQTTHLANKFGHTLTHIFQQPTSHTLEWREVITLMEHLGVVEERGSGHLVFTIEEISQSFYRSVAKEVSPAGQVLALREFLESVGIGASLSTEAPDLVQHRLLVVVSQNETRLFRLLEKGTIPLRICPIDPHPEDQTYFARIAETLTGGEELLLMGHGTGAGSAMIQFESFLTTHHRGLSNRIVGTLRLDVEALTEGQLLQEARAFFAKVG